MDFSVFRDSQIRKLIAGQALSQLCDRWMVIAVLWMIASEQKPEWIPIYIALGALPHLIFVRWTPRWIEKWGPKRVVVWGDAIRGVLLILAAAVLPWISKGDPILIFLTALAFLVNTFAAAFNPAILTLPERMEMPSEMRPKTNALLETCISSASVIAPIFSVATYASFGLTGLMLINGFSFLLAAALENAVIEKTIHVPNDVSPMRARLKSILQRDPFIIYLLGGFLLINLFLGPLIALIPLYGKHVFQGNLGTVARLETGLALGTLIGSLVYSVWPAPIKLERAIARLLFGVTCSYVIFAFSVNALMASAGLLGLGTFLGAVNVLLVGLFQSRPQEEEVPLIMSWVNLISVASLPISMGAFALFLSGSPETTVGTLGSSIALMHALMTIGFIFIPGILGRQWFKKGQWAYGK